MDAKLFNGLPPKLTAGGMSDTASVTKQTSEAILGNLLSLVIIDEVLRLI
jgi:hypothetical protein